MRKFLVLNVWFWTWFILINTFCDSVHAVDSIIQHNKIYLKDPASANKIGLIPPSLSTSWNFTFPTTAGTSNQVLTTNGSGVMSWTTPAAAGGTPGGANGNVQYNSSGSFAGSNNLFWDNTNGRLGIGISTPQAALQVKLATNKNFVLNTGAALPSGIRLEAVNDAYGVDIPLELRGTEFAFSGPTSTTYIDTSGKIGVGMTPVASYGLLQVGSPVTSALGVSGLQQFISATNSANGQNGNLAIITTDAQSVGLGGSIGLGGKFVAAGTSVLFGSIAGRKENSIDNNSAGYLSFATQPNGGTPLERFTISSNGMATAKNGLNVSATSFTVAGGVPSYLGTAAGSLASPTHTNTNILLYDNSATNWSGIGSAAGGEMYFVTGLSAPSSRMMIDTNGNIGIGINSVGASTRLHISGPYSDFSGGIGGGTAHLKIFSDSAGAINAGGQISIGGKTGNAAPDYVFAGLKGAKESAGGDDNYGGFLSFYTSSNGGVLSEGMRINKDGQVYIPNTIGGGIGNVPHNCAIVTTNSSGTVTAACASSKITMGGGCWSQSSGVAHATAYPTLNTFICQRTDGGNTIAYAVCCTY